jgi:outer membrane protein assembly factor BamB
MVFGRGKRCLGVPAGSGVIMKTASQGSTKEDPHVRVRSDCERGSFNPSPMTVAMVTLLFAFACSTTDERPAPTDSAPTTSSSSDGTDVPHGDGDWLTYHADVTRSGIAAGAPIDDVRRVWTSQVLDGDVYAEPLVIGSHVIAVTENNSVYALDGSDGQVVWRTNLGAPVDSSTLPCGNISPSSGITSTPVADPASHLIYVVAFLSPGHHEIFALRDGTGGVAWHRPMDPAGMDPLTQQLRSALILVNDRVYVAYGGLFGDCGEYHGWVAAVNADGAGSLIDYQVPTGNAGGIWAPSGAAADDEGNLFVATGNSFSADAFDLGDSVIKLSPQLKQVDFFAPQDWVALNAGDVDLGSVGPTLLPGGRVFQIGKGGVGYLLDGEKLGGIGGHIYAADVCTGAFGGTAHTVDTIYVPCSDGLVALSISPDGQRFSTLWRSPAFDTGPPIVAGGLAWTIDVSAGALVGLNERTGQEVIREGIGEVSHFASPAAANGCLFAPALRTITAFCRS